MTPLDETRSNQLTRNKAAVIAAIVAGLTLVSAGIGRYDGFARPSFAGALLLQAGIVLLLIVESYPWRDRERPRHDFAVYLLASYGLVCILSNRWAPQTHLAAIGSITALNGVFLALLISRLVHDRRSMRIAIGFVIVAGAMASTVALLCIMNYFPDGKMPLGIRLFTEGVSALKTDWIPALERIERVQGHRNFLAIFVLPPIVLCAAELLASRLTSGMLPKGMLGWPRWLIMILLLLQLAILFACKSWGALVGLFAAALCFSAIEMTRKARMMLLGCILLVITIGFIFLSLPSTQQSLVSKAQGTRLFMWKGTLRMAAERPLLGWGTGMFMLHFPDFKPHEPMKYGWLASQTIYPHNELLLVIVEVGLIGLLLYLGFHFCAVGRFVRNENKRNDPWARYAGWSIVAGSAAMFTHGLVEVSLRFWAPAAMYWTMLGLLMAIPCLTQHGRPAAPRDRRLDMVAFCLSLLLAVFMTKWLIWSGAKSEWLMGRGRIPVDATLTREKYASARADELSEAVQNSRYVPDVLEAMGMRARNLSVGGLSSDAIVAFNALYAISPGFITREGHVRSSLARLYLEQAVRGNIAQSQDAFQTAKRYCREAIQQNPYDAQSRMIMVEILLRASPHDVPQALEEARQAATAPNATARVLVRVGVLHAQSGRREEALEYLERAVGRTDKDDSLLKDIENIRQRINRM